MKATTLTCLMLIYGGRALSQNLVPNGSFEEYTECPDYFSQWNRVVGWTSPYTTSADYFNACAGGIICSVPFNQFGYQEAYDGDGYMGLGTFAYGGAPLYREVIATELLTPLQVGVPVCVSFRAACGGYGSAPGNSAAWKARGPGLQFFMELPIDWETYLYPNTAAIYMDTVLSDTANWEYVSGFYVPDSGYRFIAITNYFEDSLSWPEPLEGGGGFPAAYAFVDDVRISMDLNYCDQGSAIADATGVTCLAVTNPFIGDLELRSTIPSASDRKVEVYNVQGGRVRCVQWPVGSGSLQIPFADLPSGSYLVTISGPRGTAQHLSLVHLTP